MFNDLFTWEFVAGFVGMVASVSLITQLIKNVFDKTFGKIKTEKLVYFISLVVIIVVVATTQNFNCSWQEIIQKVFTMFLNSILLSFVSMKSYENILSKIPTLFNKEN